LEIVDADIPNILGMPFLSQVNPTICWRTRFMKVRKGTRTVVIPLAIFQKSQGSSFGAKKEFFTQVSN
jgi:hypothetical protein